MGHRCRFTGWLAFATIVVASSGCATEPREPVVSEPPSPDIMLLEPGDEVDIRFYYTPELNILQRVRVDGRISLVNADDVMAAGRSPAQLRAEITNMYEGELRDPQVTVIVGETPQQKVYVGGQVVEPGLVPMFGPLTALEAIFEAGGFDLEQADVKDVIVIRQGYGRRYGVRLDFKQTLEGDPAEPFYLRPHDVVYVSRTRISELNQWVQQYISNMIPENLFIRYPVGDGDIGAGTR